MWLLAESSLKLSPDVALKAFCGGIVALLVSTALLRLSCYFVREDVPGWAAALGIKLGALLIGLVFSGFFYSMVAAAMRQQKAKADALIALNLFMILANILLNVGVYKVTMPWLSFAKSLLVVMIEGAMGLVISVLVAAAVLFVVTSMGWYTVDELQEMFTQ